MHIHMIWINCWYCHKGCSPILSVRIGAIPNETIDVSKLTNRWSDQKGGVPWLGMCWMCLVPAFKPPKANCLGQNSHGFIDSTPGSMTRWCRLHCGGAKFEDLETEIGGCAMASPQTIHMFSNRRWEYIIYPNAAITSSSCLPGAQRSACYVRRKGVLQHHSLTFRQSRKHPSCDLQENHDSNWPSIAIKSWHLCAIYVLMYTSFWLQGPLQ